MSDIKDTSLAAKGEARIEWALKEMPVIRGLMDELAKVRRVITKAYCISPPKPPTSPVPSRLPVPTWYCARVTRLAPRMTLQPRW